MEPSPSTSNFLAVSCTSDNSIPSVNANNNSVDDEVASICPLITPSPPTNAFIQSPESIGDVINAKELQDLGYTVIDRNHLTTILQQVQDSENPADQLSSSSSSSNNNNELHHRNNSTNAYHHLIVDHDNSINGDAIKESLMMTNGGANRSPTSANNNPSNCNLENSVTAEEETPTCLPEQLTFRNPSESYFFMSWNWPLWRRISLWFFLAGLVAMTALAISMIIRMPRTCNPITRWYQGSIIYDATQLPANTVIGEDTVIFAKTMGARAIRIQPPWNTSKFMAVQSLANQLHARNLSLIVDVDTNNASAAITDQMKNWIRHGVDGFYVHNVQSTYEQYKVWKTLIGPDRALIVSDKCITDMRDPYENLAQLGNAIDLIDVSLEPMNRSKSIQRMIAVIQNGTRLVGAPWIHWSVEHNHQQDLVDYTGWQVMQLMLPGTISLPLTTRVLRRNRMNINDTISEMIHLRTASPSIYVNAVEKDGHIRSNTEVLHVRNDQLVVIQRWYPRRKSFAVISNLDLNKSISVDLSSWLYSGVVVAGSDEYNRSEGITFKRVALRAGQSIVTLLD